MKILTQEEHKEYIQNLRAQGYSMPEVIVNLPKIPEELPVNFPCINKELWTIPVSKLI